MTLNQHEFFAPDAACSEAQARLSSETPHRTSLRMVSPSERKRHLALHDRAVAFARAHSRSEAGLLRTIREIGEAKAYRTFNRSSLFQYCLHELKLSETVAGCFIFVARHGARIPALAEAVESGALPASKASRIAKTLTAENAAELVAFARANSTDEINREIARRNPGRRGRDKATAVAANLVGVRAFISEEAFERLKRVQSLEAQRGRPCEIGDAIAAAVEEYLEKRDPVRRAQRAKTRAEKPKRPADGRRKSSGDEPCLNGDEPCLNKVLEENEACLNKAKEEGPLCANKVPRGRPSLRRVPLTAAQRHAVFLRDGGRCTHQDAQGRRCGSDRYAEAHHVVPVSRGGCNDLDNLQTLCSDCHELVHQLSLPIEGQVSWLRAPGKAYVA